jgi:hypothetical protein
MRGFLTCAFAIATLSITARGAATGVPPRAVASEYPSHGQADAATIAAAIVPPNQVAKMFSPEINKQYIVVEVAIYPEGGVPFDVQSADFALRVGQRVGRADRPLDVSPWREDRRPLGRLPVDVTTEVGVIHESSDDPAYGRQHGVGTYTGVSVSTPDRNVPPPPPDPRVDPRAVYDKVRRLALAEGETKRAIAGYLYFPQYSKRKKQDEIELKYAKDDASVNLILGKP